jgi:hypothetical protein
MNDNTLTMVQMHAADFTARMIASTRPLRPGA